MYLEVHESLQKYVEVWWRKYKILRLLLHV